MDLNQPLIPDFTKRFNNAIFGYIAYEVGLHKEALYSRRVDLCKLLWPISLEPGKNE